MQNPGDYLVHERVCDEAPAAALRAVGLDGPAFAQRHPRELSGGEKQRLALAVVLGDPDEGAEPTAALCLDEPTRGMDRDHKRALTALLERARRRGARRHPRHRVRGLVRCSGCCCSPMGR